MAKFCIPKQFVETLKNAALKGKVNIAEINDMSSAARRAYFAKYTNKELGKFINTEFEKAKVKGALTDWAESTFSPKQKKEAVYKSMIDKINSLDELGVLTPANRESFLEDLVANRLGVTVTPEEVKIISEKAASLEKAYAKVGDNLGDVANKLEDNLAYFKEKKAMDDYVNGLNPSSKLKIFSSVVGRASMLFSVKSPTLNIESNTLGGFLEAFSRRLGSGQYIGRNGSIARKYIKGVNKIFKETGFDVSRMYSINDAVSGGEKTLGEKITSTAGKGLYRKGARAYEDFVFGKLMSAPDVAFSSFHFADSSNLFSTKMAKSLGLKGADLTKKSGEIMQDAMKIVPETAEGEIVRSQAIADAAYATWTNKSFVSNVSLSLREVLNKATGDFRVGDWLVPFVKTPANIIEAGLDYGGLGALKGLVKAGMAIKSGELKNPAILRSIFRDTARTGLGLTSAYILTKFIGDDDFMGEYDPNRATIADLAGKNYNAIRIGNKWVSLDYFGPLAVPLTGMLYARKYGNNTTNKLWKFMLGEGTQFKRLPGMDVYDSFFSTVASTNPSSAKETVENSLKAVPTWLADQLSARIIPGLAYDMAKITDKVERQTSDWQSRVMNKIPYLRELLPEKKDVFNRSYPTEGALSTLFFGARVKTGKEDDTIRELVRLQDTGNAPSLMDLRKTSSSVVAEFKKQVSEEEFNKATEEYGIAIKKKIDEIMQDRKYKEWNDEQKKKQIEYSIDAIKDRIFKDHGYISPDRKKPQRYIK